LDRLLPVVEINKEFGDFFNDPKRQRLKGWHQIILAIIALSGWVLGLVKVAAMSGLTQKP